ncbi:MULTISPECIES: ABC transporter permease [Saccharibacillus]|uniref:ABC transporter permease n=1 Tax=Saccharibacillus TaxID=456492 RepID=UPI0013107159|nr:ABC transporter permease [Saccharibacillus sp. WB 17]MWJ31593.1 ABC transporter permease subunit [Saccharibacillus sp. WB 17]
MSTRIESVDGSRPASGGPVGAAEAGRADDPVGANEAGREDGRIGAAGAGRAAERIGAVEAGRADERIGAAEAGRADDPVGANEAGRADGRIGAAGGSEVSVAPSANRAGHVGSAGPTFGAMIARSAEVELGKIAAQFKYRALPLLMALAPLALLLLNRTEGSFIRFSPENLPFTLLSLAAYVLLPLVACMLAADLFAGERERGELKIPLTRPVSRSALALGKIGAMLAYQAGLLLLLLVLSLAAALLSGAGLSDLNVPGIVGAYVLTLLPAAVLTALAAFASTLARSATLGFMLGVALIAVMNGAGLLFPSAAPLLAADYVTLYKTVIGSGIAYAQLGLGAGILLGWGAIFTAAQLLVFDGQEV